MGNSNSSFDSNQIKSSSHAVLSSPLGQLPISVPVWSQLVPYFENKILKPGDNILKETGTSLFVIVTGEISFKLDKSAFPNAAHWPEQLPAAIKKANDSFGRMNDIPLPFNITVETEAVVVQLTQSGLEKLGEKFPSEATILLDYINRDITSFFGHFDFFRPLPPHVMSMLELLSEYKLIHKEKNDKRILEKNVKTSMIYLPLSMRKYSHPGIVPLFIEKLEEEEAVIGLSTLLFDLPSLSDLDVPYNSQFITFYISDLEFLKQFFVEFANLCEKVSIRTRRYYLAQTAFSHAFTEASDLNALASIAKVRVFVPPEGVIIQQSTLVKELFIIAKGEVEVRTNNVLVSTRKPGHTLGYMSLLNPKGMTIYMKCVSKGPCVLLNYHSDAVIALAKNNSSIEPQLKLCFQQFADLTSRCKTALPFLSDLTYLYQQMFELMLTPIYMHDGRKNTVFNEGGEGQDGYVVLRGTLQASRNNINLATFSAGTLFGMLPFSLSLPRHNTVHLISDSAILASINRDMLHEVISFLPRTFFESFSAILPLWAARYIQLLRLPYFKGLHTEELYQIALSSSTVKYKRGAIILQQGDIPQQFYFVVSGSILKTYHFDEKVTEKEVIVGGEANETALVGANIRSLYSLTAKTHCTLLGIKPLDINKLLGEDMLLNLTFSLRILRNHARCEEFLRHPLAIKYFKQFIQYPNDNLNFLSDVFVFKYEHNLEKRKELFDIVVKRYFKLSESGDFQINIEDRVFKDILTIIESPDSSNNISIFDPAVNGAIGMFEESFANFKLSSLFEDFYKELDTSYGESMAYELSSLVVEAKEENSESKAFSNPKYSLASDSNPSTPLGHTPTNSSNIPGTSLGHTPTNSSTIPISSLQTTSTFES